MPHSLINSCIKVGLLGGSFNPPHAGHVYISEEALKICGIKQVWWLVSPKNPLKDASELQDYDKRLRQCRQITSNPAIIVSDFERCNSTEYTYDTLKKLIRIYPKCEFYWLMGADNLQNFHHWKKWQKILNLVPIIVFDRNDFAKRPTRYKALKQIQRFSFYRTGKVKASTTRLPALIYLRIRKNPLSSTAIRRLNRPMQSRYN